MNTGLHVRHPFTGELVPVFVANYVLMTYGEGRGDGRSRA